MRFAEVFLKLGLALVAWMLLYTHALWLAVLRVVGCGPDGDELHQLLLGISILTLGAAAAIHTTRNMPEVHAMLRWLAIPLALLLPWMAISTWQVFATVNLGASSICGDQSPGGWQLAWAPAQLMVIAAVAWSAIRQWRAATQNTGPGDH